MSLLLQQSQAPQTLHWNPVPSDQLFKKPTHRFRLHMTQQEMLECNRQLVANKRLLSDPQQIECFLEQLSTPPEITQPDGERVLPPTPMIPELQPTAHEWLESEELERQEEEALKQIPISNSQLDEFERLMGYLKEC